MPLVKAKAVSMSNGDLVTEFVDSVGTIETEYVYSTEQNYVSVKNNGNADISLKLNGVTITINPNDEWTGQIPFTSVFLSSTDKTQQVNVRAINGALSPNPSLTALEIAREIKRQRVIKPIASRSKWYQGISNGTDIDTTYRSMHEATSDFNSLVFMYGNFYNDGRTTGLSPYKLNLSVDIGGKTYPIFFNNGDTHKTIPVGGRSLSDELMVSGKKGTRFLVRGHVLQNAGEKHPIGLTLIGAQNSGEGIMSGDATTGTFVTTNSNPIFALTPLVILGIPSRISTTHKTLGICGDSISTGAGHTNTSVDGKPAGEMGFMQIGAMRAGWGYVTIGSNGQKASDFADPSKRTNQLQMVKDCDLVIVEYGTNDLAVASKTFEQLKADILAIHQVYWSMGIPTAQTTIAPQTTSTDGWATLVNQAPINSNTAGGEDSVRSRINNWIRNNNDNIRCIEIADVWESGRNSGLWRVDPKQTADGVHPNNHGHDNDAANVLRGFLLSQ